MITQGLKKPVPFIAIPVIALLGPADIDSRASAVAQCHDHPAP